MESLNAPMPGTYRVADGSRVEFTAAMAAWAPIAYEVLVATASRYRAVITYGELSEEIQERSGIRTRMLLANWIGKLLEYVATEAKIKDEPPLTSLCVHQASTPSTWPRCSARPRRRPARPTRTPSPTTPTPAAR